MLRRADLVKAEVIQYGLLRDKLREQFPSIDDDTLADTLEGLTDLREILVELVRSALEDEALLEALSTRLAEMRARLQRLGDRPDKKRALAR
jgi:signal transduction histidine kinase